MENKNYFNHPLIKNYIKDKIVEIKSEYPYTMKDLVENPKAMAERKAQLEAELDQLKEMAKLYQSRIAKMTRR